MTISQQHDTALALPSEIINEETQRLRPVSETVKVGKLATKSKTEYDHSEMVELVAAGISRGALPEEYRLPKAKDTFAQSVEALAPTSDVMQKYTLQPMNVLIPHDLRVKHWDRLLTGQKLGEGKYTNGIGNDDMDHLVVPDFDGDRHLVIDPTNPKQYERAPRLWSMAVISASKEPFLTNVAKDGVYGRNARMAMEILEALRNEAGLPELHAEAISDDEVLVRQLSPSQLAYAALQWINLEFQKTPVDSQTRTILKEDVNAYWLPHFCPTYGRFDTNNLWVEFQTAKNDEPNNINGLRPCVLDTDVLPDIGGKQRGSNKVENILENILSFLLPPNRDWSGYELYQ